MSAPALLLRPRTPSALTVTDLFAGFGGSVQGAQEAGIEPRLLVNHNPLAVNVLEANFPNASTACADIRHTAPSRFRTTDILWASPSCTRHTLAAGVLRRRRAEREATLFDAHDVVDSELDEAEASRALMLDVPRWVEFHRHRVVIVENVVEAARNWDLYPAWRLMMHALGYDLRELSLTSRVVGSPQDRDRLFIVAWRRDHPAPDLDITPVAPCAQCARDVRAVPRFKDVTARAAERAGRPVVGKYRSQYAYHCPTCASVVDPYYVGVGTALDPSLPAMTIGEAFEQNPQISDTVRLRARHGFSAFGAGPLFLTNNCTTHRGRVRRWSEPSYTLTTSPTHGIAFADTFFSGARRKATDIAPSCLPSRDAFDQVTRHGRVSASVRAELEATPWARFQPDAPVSLDRIKYRTLSIRERANIMSFRPDYVLLGTPDEQHKGIGNAVDPRVARLLLERVAATFASGAAVRPRPTNRRRVRPVHQ